MLKIDKAIFDTDQVICDNIDSFDITNRGLLSQNILSQLRNFVEYIAMKDIKDPAISEGALGACFGMKPTNGTVVSPVSGTINSVAPTKHAITIYGDHGEQVMVHIGLDSVKLNGMGIQTFVKPGMKVRTGDRIANYQKKMFESQGIDDTVVTILLNSASYKQVNVDPSDPKAVIKAQA